MILIPLIVSLLIFYFFFRKTADWREGFLRTALVVGVFVIVATESLSVFHALNVTGIAVSWLILGILILVFYLRSKSTFLPFPKPALSKSEWILSSVVIFILVLIGITALVVPVITHDSMTYHMPRVEHWLQNQTVAFYTASIGRQLYQHPLAEYLIAHLQALSGGDRFVNMVQWWALVGCTVVGSLVARQFKLNIKGQVLSALLIVTIPMAILQGSTTQNDLVTAFWLSCFVLWVIRFISEKGVHSYWLEAGISLGLLWGTKGTMYIYAMPFIIGYAGFALWWYRARAVLIGFGIGLLAITIPLPHLIRNLAYFQNPFGPDGTLYINNAMSPGLFFSNLVRNIHLELTFPNFINEAIPIDSLLNRFVLAVHYRLGLDPLNAATTWPDVFPRYDLSEWILHEDLVNAFLHTILIILTPIVYLVRYRKLKMRVVSIYAVMCFGTVFLFALILKLQPWHGRLHLPIFILFMPFVAYVLVRGFPNPLTYAFATLLVCFSIFPIFNARNRSWFTEPNIFTNDRWSLTMSPFPTLKSMLDTTFPLLPQHDCHDLTLILGGDTPEYAVWVRARDLNYPVTITNLMPTATEGQGCAILSDILDGTPREYAGGIFEPVLELENWRLFMPIVEASDNSPG